MMEQVFGEWVATTYGALGLKLAAGRAELFARPGRASSPDWKSGTFTKS